MDGKWLLVVLIMSYEIIFVLLYNIMLSSMLSLLYLVLVTNVYLFVFMFVCFMTFYDCSVKIHFPWCEVEQHEDHRLAYQVFGASFAFL